MPKATLLYSLLLSLLFLSCSKGDEPTEPPRNFNDIPQGEAPCTPAKNSMTLEGNDHPPRTFTSISKRPPGFAEATYQVEARDVGMRQIELTLHFNPKYKSNTPPPDGVYTTGTFTENFPKFKYIESDIVFISFSTHDPIFYGYQSVPGQKVYLKTVDGKMTATACDAKVIGLRNGVNYPGLFTFSITEQ